MIPNNIISYIIKSEEFDAKEFVVLLNNTVNVVVDEDNIFYQLVTINYMHYLSLSSIILSKKINRKVSNHQEIKNKLESSIGIETEDKSIVIDLIKNLNKNEIELYDYCNHLFSYIYKYVDAYSNKTAPLTIVNESMKIFRPKKEKTVVTNKYLKNQ
jgi:hypothetical protein